MGNTANGHTALTSNTSGRNNTANGYQSLYFNTTANFNTATGAFSLLNNNGIRNTATGHVALYTNTSGNNNTATGSEALYLNTVGVFNSAHGVNALYKTLVAAIIPQKELMHCTTIHRVLLMQQSAVEHFIRILRVKQIPDLVIIQM